MNLDYIQQFLELYLKEKKLKYEVKNRIYTIELNAQHKKWFGKSTDKLKVTCDAKLAKDKKIELMGPGNSIFDTMVVQYVDELPYASFSFPKQKDDIMLVNEALPQLNKGSEQYMIDEKETTAHYILLELNIETAKNRHDCIKSLLILNGKVYDVSGESTIDFSVAKKTKNDCSPHKSISQLLELAEAFSKEEIDNAREDHEASLKELQSTQYDHNTQQFKELEDKEWKLSYKIEQLRQKELNARSFEQKRKYQDDQKKQKLKLEQLKQKHEAAKAKIKEGHDKQMDAVELREFAVKAKLHAYAELELPYLTVNYKDGEEFIYIPILKKFLE